MQSNVDGEAEETTISEIVGLFTTLFTNYSVDYSYYHQLLPLQFGCHYCISSMQSQ